MADKDKLFKNIADEIYKKNNQDDTKSYFFKIYMII